MPDPNQQSQEIATMPAPGTGFTLATQYKAITPELQEELNDELEDLGGGDVGAFRRVKIPASSGAAAFIVEGEEDGTESYLKSFQAVIVYTHNANGYWADAYGGTAGKPPTCSSRDGKTGFNSETGVARSCDSCPFNQFGSAVSVNGQERKGKACKNMRRIYLMMNGDPTPYILTVPPTGLADVKRQLAKIVAGGSSYTSWVYDFSLQRGTSKNGDSFFRIVIRKAAPISDPATKNALIQARQRLKRSISSSDFTAVDADYNDTAAAPYGAAGVEPAGAPVAIYPDDSWEAEAISGGYQPPQQQNPQPAPQQPQQRPQGFRKAPGQPRSQQPQQRPPVQPQAPPAGPYAGDEDEDGLPF